MDLSLFAAAHEEGLALFVEGSHRLRFRESLANPKRRQTLLDSLDHFRHLDYKWASDASAMSVGELHHYLRDSGAPKQCYVLSSNTDYVEADERTGWKFIRGKTAALRQALDDLAYDTCGSFISCIPGQLVYYTGETPDERFILQRPAA